MRKISRARVTASRALLLCFYSGITIVKSVMKNDCENRLKPRIVYTIALISLKNFAMKTRPEI